MAVPPFVGGSAPRSRRRVNRPPRAPAGQAARRRLPSRATPASRRSRKAMAAAMSRIVVAGPEGQGRAIDRGQGRPPGIPGEIGRAVAGGMPHGIHRRRRGPQRDRGIPGQRQQAQRPAQRRLVRRGGGQPELDHPSDARRHPQRGDVLGRRGGGHVPVRQVDPGRRRHRWRRSGTSSRPGPDPRRRRPARRGWSSQFHPCAPASGSMARMAASRAAAALGHRGWLPAARASSSVKPNSDRSGMRIG